MSAVDARSIVVLGAGRVGGLIARDLATDLNLAVTAVDRDGAGLARLAAASPRLSTRALDLGDTRAIAQAVADADVVVGAVPGALGWQTLAAVIESGCAVVDISFMPEDPLRLDAAARARGVTAVVDCGVAPGISNWLVGHAASELETVEVVDIVVGGLPFRRVWPFEYRAVFSPADVIEEYTRPCRMRVGGQNLVVPALGGVERLEFDEVGTLEAFDTDGLRTLLHTIAAPTLRERTLRWPGHADRMAFLRDAGFFDTTPRSLADGTLVAPRSLTERVLEDGWRRDSTDDEFTVLRVTVSGTVSGQKRTIVWDLFDRTDRETGETSMARTTGFPCAIVARWLAAGLDCGPGIVPPERLGADPRRTAELVAELRRRGVDLRRRPD